MPMVFRLHSSMRMANSSGSIQLVCRRLWGIRFCARTAKNTIPSVGTQITTKPHGHRQWLRRLRSQMDGSGLRQITTVASQVISPTGWIDNQTIVYAVMGGEGFTFTSYNLESGATKILSTIQNKAGYGAISPDGQWIAFADHIVGEVNWGIFISQLDGSQRKLVVEPQVPTSFSSAWSPDSQWLIVNTKDAKERDRAVLVNPFTCQVFSLHHFNGPVEGWSP